MKRSVILVAAAATVLTSLASASQATHKKPISKTYTATAPAPDPTNWVEENYSVCNQVVPNSWHAEAFKAPEAGTLKVELTGYQGDWDLLVVTSKKQEVANSGSGDLGVPEKLTYKVKKADTFSIIACNWAGGPTGTVKYTFTYAK